MLKVDMKVKLLLNLLAIIITKSKSTLETLQTTSLPSTLFKGSSPINCDIKEANLFNNYFYSIFTKTSTSPATSSDYPTIPTLLFNIAITKEEVYDCLYSQS